MLLRTNSILVNVCRLTVTVGCNNFCKLSRTASMSTNPVIKIVEGQIKGKTLPDYLGNKFYSFLGIPYAEPPIGDLRFKAPVPVKPWEGVRDATKEGPACPSKHQLFLHNIGEENNCLVLNAFTKELPKADTNPNLKPVMVWIHGGGFMYGSSELDVYGPEYLMTEDIVLVSINYRLGIFGFLSLKDPTLDVPGNAGMKDMVLALQWVQKNIANFGGDPKNVTIFGESAGSAAVHYLLLSPSTKGLFHKAIMQSGCVINPWARGVINGHLAAKYTDCKDSDDEEKILEYLKQLPTQKIAKAQYRYADLFSADIIRPFGPVIEPYRTDHTFLSHDPLEIIKNGTYHQVPLIIGYTSQEGIFFEAVRKFIPGAKITTDFETEINHLLNIEKGSERAKEIAAKLKKFYYDDEEPTEQNLEKLYMLKTDTEFVYDIHRSINAHKSTSTAPIYVYRMSLDTALNHFKSISTSKIATIYLLFNYLAYKCGNGVTRTLLLKLANTLPTNTLKGVCHADDLSYLLKSLLSNKLSDGTIEELSVRRFVKLWTNFAKTSNPTPHNQNDDLLNVCWKPLTKDEFNYLDIGETLKLDKDPDLDRIKSLNSIYNVQ